jgi:hypothetical protein
MGMFSKELLELDKNTVDIMIEELREEINKKNRALEEQKQAMEEALAEKDALIKKLQGQIRELA